MVFDVYYGFPNLYTTVFKAAYANSGTEEDIKISGLGPVGFRGEYLIADKIGLGLDIGFNNTKISFKETFNETNSNGQIVEKTYTYDYKTSKLGVMLTFNYHFIDNDQVDFYGVFGVGYGNRNFSFESTNPNFTSINQESLIPIASRIGIGVRYFFTDNIGLNVAAGFGQGGILNAGVSVKI